MNKVSTSASVEIEVKVTIFEEMPKHINVSNYTSKKTTPTSTLAPTLLHRQHFHAFALMESKWSTHACTDRPLQCRRFSEHITIRNHTKKTAPTPT